MEDLLRCFTHPLRARILALLLERPMAQAELVRALDAEGSAVNPGTVSRVMAPLFAEGLVTRDSPRGACHVAHPQEVRLLLGALHGLLIATTRAAESRSKAIRRDSAQWLAVAADDR